jgi:lipoate-protein ligase A
MIARLLVDPPAGGAWNMAVDEALLEQAAQGAPPVLRYYGWTPATLSLGYFQRALARLDHKPSRPCPLVRRPSGGGAIVHDRELTYALVVPAGHRLSRESAGLYRAVHGALAEALAQWSIDAQMFRCTAGEGCADSGDDDSGEGGTVRGAAFLCFQRRGEGDLVVRGVKIAGSAQRRRRGAVLQHGSVLLATSPEAPELPGLAEVCGQRIDLALLRSRWTACLAARLDLSFDSSSLLAAERQVAVELQRARYAAGEWTYRR